jgi:hypothetical protein
MLFFLPGEGCLEMMMVQERRMEAHKRMGHLKVHLRKEL